MVKKKLSLGQLQSLAVHRTGLGGEMINLHPGQQIANFL